MCHLHAQDAREAESCMDEYGKIVADIVKEMKVRGNPAKDDMSVGAQLLRAKDPSTGWSTIGPYMTWIWLEIQT